MSSGNITDAVAKFRQKFTLDQLGNWSDLQQDGLHDYTTVANNSFADATDLDQDRLHNDANKIDNEHSIIDDHRRRRTNQLGRSPV